MYYFGAPEFYETHVRQRPPTTREEVLIEIEKLRAKKKIRENQNHVESSNNA